MLLDDASHPVYCAAFDGLFVLSVSCSITVRTSLNIHSSPCYVQRNVCCRGCKNSAVSGLQVEEGGCSSTCQMVLL